MRVTEKTKVNSDKTDMLKKGRVENIRARKINWPDLMFGPVNLWSLPPAWFFYKKEKRANSSLSPGPY
jgi:hypothetical protein